MPHTVGKVVALYTVVRDVVLKKEVWERRSYHYSRIGF